MKYKILSFGRKGSRRMAGMLPALVAVIAVMVSLLFSGCKKDYINGDLDGLWELQEITVNGEAVAKDRRLYWSFAFHVVQLSEYGEVVSKGNLSFDGSSIAVDFPFDTSEEGAAVIRDWGVYENPVTFTVDHLDSSTLKMTAGDVTLRLKKF